MNKTHDILFTERPGQGGNLGIITLNRPKALNALNHVMIKALFDQLEIWANAQHIKAVIIQGEGRAFCAGGDIRETYERYLKKDTALAEFFRDEYELNRFIFHYPKPYIALLSGITMGGGVGISLHGSHRVGAEQMTFAMPETTIGFYPDVGGTYFLSRLQNHLGIYLGLTGNKIMVDDCLALGIVTHKIRLEKFPDIIAALAEHDFSKDQADTAVTKLLNSFKLQPQDGPLLANKDLINYLFDGATIESIITKLKDNHSPFAKDALKTLEQKSPTSLKVTLKALQLASKLDFDQSMQQEYTLTQHFLNRPDFPEGIRALLIDKDNQPQWQPPTLTKVSDELVLDYFLSTGKMLA